MVRKPIRAATATTPAMHRLQHVALHRLGDRQHGEQQRHEQQQRHDRRSGCAAAARRRSRTGSAPAARPPGRQLPKISAARPMKPRPLVWFSR